MNIDFNMKKIKKEIPELSIMYYHTDQLDVDTNLMQGQIETLPKSPYYLQDILLQYIRLSEYDSKFYYFSYQDYNLQNFHTLCILCFKIQYFNVLYHVLMKYLNNNLHIFNNPYDTVFTNKYMNSILKQINNEISNHFVCT